MIAEVIPAAKRPIPRKYFATFPYKGAKPSARSRMLLIPDPVILAAATMIAMEIMPPTAMERKRSF